ncbi:alpha-amylase [Penicillium pulvis]|uniref:alpha-amylase n=1 Tax=Penicillium pulvis TaxID=1562058 RepID=UPI0025470E77|nr:alpha-amylase [Penicillium pulvis]KAJ5814029.1 alpha-amylase [Penicillium pulvis]
MASHQVEKTWWKEAIVYQIYPASFSDSNGDGLGDVRGIINKVPYIKSLGVNTIWLSPIYASPQKDMGYDVSDYRSIHAPYGTVEDVQELIDLLHANDIRLLMDLVVNHTSDEHAWFKESRSSKTNPKRDWYIWRDPRYDARGQRKEPNNWASIFGGPAWQFDEHTGQYYLALFLPSQPDLNWESEDMRRAAHDDMRFWLDRGVDGFRIDSMNLMSKHPDLPDGKVINDEPYQSGAEFFASGPRMHDYIREMRTKVFEKYDIMTVGELGFTKDEDSVREYVAKDRHELNMLFTGDIVDMDFGAEAKYGRNDFHPRKIRHLTNMWQNAMPKFDGWNTVYLDNHDSGRSITRYASDAPEYRAASAKMLATYLTTLSGTPFLLAGQEIGMANLGKEYGAEAYIDVEGKNYYNKVLKARGGDVGRMGDVLRELQLKARDHGRLPMQWDSSANAGFTTASEPWMVVNKDYTKWNVESQLDDPGSVMGYWKEMIAMRKKMADLFVYGSYVALSEEDTGEMVLGYERVSQTGQKAVVLLNFSDAEQKVSKKFEHLALLVSNQGELRVGDGEVVLQPFGAVVLYSA